MRALLLQHNSPRLNFAIPLGLAYIGAVLKGKGVEVKIVDATAPYAHYRVEDLVKMAEDFDPQFVGMTITTLFVGFAYDLVKGLKRLKVPIIAGGPHPTLFPHEVLRHGVDIVIRGEGEKTAEELIDYFEDKIELKDILGISYWRDREVVDNPPRPFIDDLDELPSPEKGLFNIRDYVRDNSDLWRYGGIISSRGCLGRCSFCSRKVFGRRYRFRSPDNVLKEIEALHREYGISRFSFLDDVFTASQERIRSLCEKIRSKIKFDLTWSCITRVDCICLKLLKDMFDAGCRLINYGVESANPKTLEKLNKGVTIEEIEERIQETKACGIDCSINFMWGYPWESAGELKNSIDLMKRLSESVKEIMPGGILIPFPDTQIYEEYKDIFNFREWWLKRGEFTGSYRIRHFSPLFRIFFFDDQGQLEGPGFFNFSQRIKRRINYAANFIGRHNLKYYNPKLEGIILIACLLSKSLYKLHPRLERLFSRIVFIFLNIGHRITRGRKTFDILIKGLE